MISNFSYYSPSILKKMINALIFTDSGYIMLFMLIFTDSGYVMLFMPFMLMST